MKRIKHLHLVGVGGTGMCGIAEILLNLGYRVSGSDLQATPVTERLASLGARVVQGHRPENVRGADVVVISSAVRDDNPEVVQARRLKIPVIRRAEMLAELMRLKYGIGIAGTHGKTTTTSMTGTVLRAGGLDPTVIVGGRVRDLGSNAKIGQGEYLVAEADEFDRSFLSLTPTIAVVTNIESEHLDCYRDLVEIEEAFLTFCSKVPFYGSAVLCIDDRGVREILPRLARNVIRYGLSPEADVRAEEITFAGSQAFYTALARDRVLGDMALQVPGVHNVKNSLAAMAVGLELEIPFAQIKEALGEFTGVHRRFECKGEKGGVMVIDDYAHHPTEIEASLQGARDGWGRRTVVLFQPHLYSRTQRFATEFGRSFKEADVLFVTDVYPAREQPIPGVTGELIAAAAREAGHPAVQYVPDKRALAKQVLEVICPGDMVITMGAGDIWEAGEEILAAL